MVLSPKKYVLLRAKVLEMNSKSLEVDDAEEHGLQRRGTRTEHGAKACVKNGENPAARGSSCVLERGCFMSASSARAGGAPLVKVCGDGPRTFSSSLVVSILSIGVYVSDWIKQGSNAVFGPQALRHRHFLRITPPTKQKNSSRYLRGSRPLKGTALRAGPRWLHPS